jgi:hypothetical protein
MDTTGIKYHFNSKPWKYIGPGSWIFISLPEDVSREIRNNLKSEEQGWGRLKAVAKIRKTEWKTAIWFDTKMKTYLLPLKAAIRKKESIEIDKKISVTIWV